mmetsp:Transcript_36151/g.64651  ORF Transcript_36151/g.64651 Transcript_36151/m.64651 type:complete len:272 (-) Transcript_36151:67-882(-)
MSVMVSPMKTVLAGPTPKWLIASSNIPGPGFRRRLAPCPAASQATRMPSTQAPLRDSSSRSLSWIRCSPFGLSSPLPTLDWLVTTHTCAPAALSAATASAAPGRRRRSAASVTPGLPTSSLMTPSRSMQTRKGSRSRRRAAVAANADSISTAGGPLHHIPAPIAAARRSSCTAPLETATPPPPGTKARAPLIGSSAPWRSDTRPPASRTHTTPAAWSQVLRRGKPLTGCWMKAVAEPSATAAYLQRLPQQRGRRRGGGPRAERAEEMGRSA